MKIIKVALLVLVAVSVTACSSLTGGRKVDYKSAKQYSRLEIPPDLSSIPPSQQDSGINTYSGYSAEQIAKGPTHTSVLPSFNKVRIKRSGAQRWLVVDVTPQSLWPQLREFVFGLGLAIGRENKTTGVIETDWAENRAGQSSGGWFSKIFSSLRDTGLRDKYRIRIEKGVKRGTTEIYLTHQGLEEVVASGGGADIVQTVWQRRPSDPDLEAEMLRLLMVHLGVEDAKARSLLTGGIGRARATLQFDDKGVAQMMLTDNFGSAWRRVGKALDKVGAKIENKDRSKGIFAIVVTELDAGKKEPGFFSKMFGRDKKNGRPYRVRVSAEKTGSEVQLLDVKKDRRIDNADGKRFMKSLFEELR
ncbi:MAG: outer membrane protein assembly factor BamC [Acidiferrobacterales bacterium]